MKTQMQKLQRLLTKEREAHRITMQERELLEKETIVLSFTLKKTNHGTTKY